MTTEALIAADNERAQKALPILLHPELYKVCDVCHSISFKRAAVCPVCHAYRWRDRIRSVQAVLRIILRRPDPFPVTCGTVPRTMNNA